MSAASPQDGGAQMRLQPMRRKPPNSKASAWVQARDVESDGSYDRCVEPVLRALGWRGEQAQILEAMPHFVQLKTVSDLRLVFHHMGFQSTIDTVSLAALSEDLLPAIWVNAERPMVVLERRPDRRVARSPYPWALPRSTPSRPRRRSSSECSKFLVPRRFRHYAGVLSGYR